MVSETTPLNELFEMMKRSTKKIRSGEIFIINELFRGFEWNRIPRGDRTKLGLLYMAYAVDEGTTVVDRLGKTPQNQQKYIKL